PREFGGYNAFVAKMASKNVMNHYHGSCGHGYRNPLLKLVICADLACSVLAEHVAVALRGRWLGEIGRVGSRKAFLEPLLQRRIKPALFGILAGSGLRTGATHRHLLAARDPSIWQPPQSC